MKKERNKYEKFIVRGLIVVLGLVTVCLLFIPNIGRDGRGLYPGIAEVIIMSLLPIVNFFLRFFGIQPPDPFLPSYYDGSATQAHVGGSTIAITLLLVSAGTGLIWSGYRHRIWQGMLMLLLGIGLLAMGGMNEPIMAMLGLLTFLFFRALFRSFLGDRPFVGGYLSGFSIGSVSLVVMMFATILATYQDKHPISIPLMGTAALQYLAILSILLVVAMRKLNPALIPRSIRIPRGLPRLRPRKSGFTLIELLIVVAIIAISVPMILNLFKTASQTSMRSRDAQQAVRLARNEIERLRGGVYALEPGTRAETVDGLPMEVVIAAAREDGLVPVTVTFTIGPESAREPLAFSALIPPAREVSDATN